LKDFLEIYTSISDFPSANEFPDLDKDNDNKYLIIFDDCVNDTDTKSEKKMKEYFTYGRAKGLTCCFLSQSYFQTNIFIRKQVSWVLLCGINSNRDLKSILKEYAIGDVSDKQLKEMYEYAKTQEEPNDVTFLKICTYHCPMDKKFSRNWIQYLNPNEFPK
jgi:hypothetical protein